MTDAIAVADHFGLDRFYSVGVSTGGAYALAVAAAAPDRVLGVVACCSMTDMSNRRARSTMPAGASEVWDAADRDGAIAAAAAQFGEDGSRMLSGPEGAEPIELAAADMALLTNPDFLEPFLGSMSAQFAHGVAGYTDDRLADGPGWVTFDVAAVTCPVTLLHGTSDTIVDPMQATVTAELIPHATLRWVDGAGHLSVISEIIPALLELN